MTFRTIQNIATALLYTIIIALCALIVYTQIAWPHRMIVSNTAALFFGLTSGIAIGLDIQRRLLARADRQTHTSPNTALN